MEVILKTVVSPKDASSLLLKCRVFCFILSDNGKTSIPNTEVSHIAILSKNYMTRLIG